MLSGHNRAEDPLLSAFVMGVVLSFPLFSFFTGVIMVNGQAQEQVFLGERVVDAINCGGQAHIDSHGIQYRGDPLEGRIGIASDHGRRYIMARANPQDQPLYQTERYSDSDFEYNVQIPSEGDYVLVLKFSEVYFEQPNGKIFDVHINDNHRVVPDLDIFLKAGGKAIAHDEIIPFTIKDGRLRIRDESSEFAGQLSVQLKKGRADNPKLNAFYVIQGQANDIPPLPKLQLPDDLVEQESKMKPQEEKFGSPKKPSGPKVTDPYSMQDQSQTFLPILVALACFFPLLFCLCKL